MKKSFALLACAFALMLAMPAMAFAGQFSSPGGTTANNNGTTLHVDGDVNSNGGYIVVEGTEASASNAEYDSNDYVASFRVYSVGDIDFTSFTFTFNVPSKYAGKDGTIFADYGAPASSYALRATSLGGEEEFAVTFGSNGVATVTVNSISENPSYFTLVTDFVEDGNQGGEGGGEDNGSTSPETGVDFTVVTAAGFTMLIAAAGVFCALRKRSSVR